MQGGSVIRLFHRELEAYLVCEGLFWEELVEDGMMISENNVTIILIILKLNFAFIKHIFKIFYSAPAISAY